ncbi:MAG TPA: hypothetical protein PLN21_11945 [Gemmatales bacterium]|nr:hypothetical protein [Gemmatales bacterium]
MNLLTLGMVAALGMGELDTPQAPATPAAPAANASSSTPMTYAPEPGTKLFYASEARPMFLSDHEFDSFIGPITNPILSKDPRSNTYLRPMFINNNFPDNLGGGSTQIYAMQANLAINERLSIIADKDGLARIDANAGLHETGWLNIAAGLKYTFLRDVENQTLGAVGFQFEAPWGGNNVVQGYGSGVITTFLTGGQKIGDSIHVLDTFGYQFPTNTNYNSSFLYNSFHIDYAINCWFYPLFEVNWFHYTASGNQIPPVGVEGDGLLNFGTPGVTGNDLVTLAFGAKAKLSSNVEFGAAWEFPVTGRKDINENRLVTELILRY